MLNQWIKALLRQADTPAGFVKGSDDGLEGRSTPERAPAQLEALESRVLFSADLSVASVNTDDGLMVDYNIAGQDASAFDLAVYRSSDGVTLDSLVATQRIDDADGLTVGTHTQDISAELPELQEGEQFIVVIDAADEVAESDESNNTAVFLYGQDAVTQDTAAVQELESDAALLQRFESLEDTIRAYPPPGASDAEVEMLISSLIPPTLGLGLLSSVAAAPLGGTTMSASTTTYTASVISPCTGSQSLNEISPGALYSGTSGTFTLGVLSLNSSQGTWYLTIYDYANPTGPCYPFAQFGQVTSNSSDPTGVYGLMVGGSPNTGSGTAVIS